MFLGATGAYALLSGTTWFGRTENERAKTIISSFDTNRRTVDTDPSAYIAGYSSSPQNCEDYYLVGRAYLLTGDFIKARASFTESRNRLPDADPVNVNVLASDLAIGMAVTNDTTIQAILKKEFDASRVTSSANANTNVNR
jgi:hypothetical protein